MNHKDLFHVRVYFISIQNTSIVCICIIPLSTGQVFFPIVNTVFIEISCIFSSCWITLISIYLTIEIYIFFTIIPSITIGIVIPRICSLCWISISTINLYTIINSITISISFSWISKPNINFITVSN